MHDITKPLRLAVGSHKAGSGKGCAMNVISWENGDATITDLPQCSDPFLARVVQSVNDEVCAHRDGDLLCSDCSVKVLELGHRTVGTNLKALGWDAERIRRVHVEIALEEAESVARDDEDPRVTRCREVTRAWLGGKASRGQVLAAYAAAAYPSDAYAADAASAAALAAAHAYAAAASAAALAAYAAYAAADASAYAASAASAAGGACRLQRAHRIIDRFEEITGTKARTVPAETAAAAVEQMMATS